MTMIPAGALIRNREVPELGSGRIISESEDGSVRVAFENAEEVREVRLEHADIVRQPLIRGTLVKVQRGDEVKEGEIVEVDWPDSPRELCAYTVDIGGSEQPVFESQVTPLEPQSSDPRDQFASLHWRGPFRFFSRWDMHRTISRWYEDSEGVPTLIGSRIEPAVHHAHAVRSVLWDSARRHLLADEDPEARLYEAAMIAQYMNAADPDLNVLVVAPGRRTHRWQADFEIRFGSRSYVRVDAGHLQANPRERWSSVAENQRLIMSTVCLQRYADACSEMLLGSHWDLIIFDDAHLLEEGEPAHECLEALSRAAENLLVLSALPATLDVDELGALVSLLDPAAYADAPADMLEERVEEFAPLWEQIAEADALVSQLDEADQDEIAEAGDALAELLDDEFVSQRVEELEEDGGDAFAQLVDYVHRYYRLEPRVLRTRREQLGAHGVEWNERVCETVPYEADDAEAQLVEHLQGLDDAQIIDPARLAMRGIYWRAASSSPDRFFTVLEQRLDAIETSAGQEDLDMQIIEFLSLDPGPAEEEMLEDQIISRAPSLPGEGEWIAEAMSLVGQWHADSAVGCARFEAAAEWMEGFFDEHAPSEDDEEEQAPPSVVVCCVDRQTVQDAAFFLESHFDVEAVEMVHAGMDRTQHDETLERFRSADEAQILVCDETGAEGRDLSTADALVHLEHPWSLGRLERRISRLDKPHGDAEGPVRSAVIVGPSPIEQAIVELCEQADIYETCSADIEYELAKLDRRLWLAACQGVDDVAALGEQLAIELDEAREENGSHRAYRRSLDAPAARLEADAEFADLLDFIDGVADSLPIRHWARMLGMEDQSAAPNIYEFKWHWSKVRRSLSGYDTNPEDVDFLLPEDQVGMVSGTFSRKRALRSESLEFLAPGHRFIDALVEDALGPTDGRATVFARRLGPQNRGKMFLNVVGLTKLEPEAWGELDMPRGLLTRAYRYLWPESVSVPVEFDLKGRREPTLVEDFDLIQKIEQSYQGPEADQKIEYEVFLQAIEDAARFRSVLSQAIEVAMEDLEEQRAGLIEGAVDELLTDLRPEMAYYQMQEERGVPGAQLELALREKLVDSLRQERLELDSLAVIVAGTPQVLRR